MDVIQPPQLLALCGHELAPVMGGLAMQTPPALTNMVSATTCVASSFLLSDPMYTLFCVQCRPSTSVTCCEGMRATLQLTMHGADLICSRSVSSVNGLPKGNKEDAVWQHSSYSTKQQPGLDRCPSQPLKTGCGNRTTPVAFRCLEVVNKLAPIGQKLFWDAATEDTCTSQTSLSLTCYVVKGNLAHS